MSHKRTIGVLLGLCVLAFVAGFILTDPETYGICSSDQYYSCSSPMLNNVGQPLFMGSIALALIFIILIFLSKHYFSAWLKYAAWFIPVGILLIIFTDTNCSGGLGLGLCFDKELATWWSSGIYLGLSLIVIIITAFQRRKPAIYTPSLR